ncbi:MAG: hypothetical protein ACRDYE_01880, partial [Acidimicrobiales bacterium]
NELTSGPSGSYTYDPDGQETSSSHQFSNLTYDSKLQTTSITPSGGSAEPFTYSGAGQADRLSAGTTSFANGLSARVPQNVGTPDARKSGLTRAFERATA